MFGPFLYNMVTLFCMIAPFTWKATATCQQGDLWLSNLHRYSNSVCYIVCSWREALCFYM